MTINEMTVKEKINEIARLQCKVQALKDSINLEPEIPRRLYEEMLNEAIELIVGWRFKVNSNSPKNHFPIEVTIHWEEDRSFSLKDMAPCYSPKAGKSYNSLINKIHDCADDHLIKNITKNIQSDKIIMHKIRMHKIAKKFDKRIKDVCKKADQYEKNYYFSFDSLIDEAENHIIDNNIKPKYVTI